MFFALILPHTALRDLCAICQIWQRNNDKSIQDKVILLTDTLHRGTDSKMVNIKSGYEWAWEYVTPRKSMTKTNLCRNASIIGHWVNFQLTGGNDLRIELGELHSEPLVIEFGGNKMFAIRWGLVISVPVNGSFDQGPNTLVWLSRATDLDVRLRRVSEDEIW